MIRYPYGRQSIDEADIEAVVRVLRAPMLTQGPEVERFETSFAASTGARNPVAVSNGTAALHLAYVAAGLNESRGLICSPITFLATAAAARMLNAPVAFADVDASTGLVTPETVEQAIATAPFDVGAVTVVHLGGRMCDLSGLSEVCAAAGALLIEDACHAPGACHVDENGRNVPAGACTLSDFATFSFHPVKHIATGEGGAVCCRDPQVAERLKRLRSHGMDRRDEALPRDQETGPWSYANPEIGWNYRLTDLQAALGTSQLSRLPQSLARRRENAGLYDEALAGSNEIRPPPLPEDACEHAWHLYPVAIDFGAIGKSRGTIMKQLAERGIGTQVHYIPLYRQETYQEAGPRHSFPGAEQYYKQSLSIPMYPGLSNEDVAFIAGALSDVVRH